MGIIKTGLTLVAGAGLALAIMYGAKGFDDKEESVVPVEAVELFSESASQMYSGLKTGVQGGEVVVNNMRNKAQDSYQEGKQKVDAGKEAALEYMLENREKLCDSYCK